METGGPRPSLTFLGAAGTVTGSRFLVRSGTTGALVDAGLYQGLASLRRKNWEPFAVPPGELAAVVLTHAHLDHCGFLPRLVREGFAGRVVSTPETRDLAAIVLRDSARLQEEDARDANRRGWSKHDPALPLYGEEDVERTLPLFAPVEYGESARLGADLEATLWPAGHILGSGIVAVEAEDRRVVFSGDLGRPGHPLLVPPAAPPPARTLVMESTYGDRRHPPADAEVLAGAVRRTIGRGGSVLIPAFAVDRTELVLLELRRLTLAGLVPRVPVYIDSPMALATLGVYRAALARPSARLRPDRAGDLAGLGGPDGLDLHEVHDAAGSERLNDPDEPCIIVSASGMATGGRVVHHLAHQLPDSRNCVVLTGYQAVGTRGRQLLEGTRHLKMYGRYVPVRAEIVDVPDFSVHADADELVAWVRTATPLPETVYLVHGEVQASLALARRIEDELGICAVVPREGERVLID